MAKLPFVDIQKVAMANSSHDNAISGRAGRTGMPGLAAVTKHWLRMALNKEEQCSDWDARPLSKRQLEYAACDAAVLIDIAEAMGLSS